MLHTGSDDLDPTLGIPVQPAELLLLGVATHTDRVGTTDDLRLGDLAPQRLGIAALGLHPGERVERRHERHLEVVLESMADHPAQPVVGVDDVGLFVLLDLVEDTGVERIGDVGERLFRQVMRTRLDVDDAMAGLDEHLARQTGAVGPRVRRALDARLGERRHHLAHVDVHAAAVAGTGLQQRRRVERDVRDTLHSSVNDNQAVPVLCLRPCG